MEMRALLAIILSMLALTLYQYFFVPAPAQLPPPPPGPQPAPVPMPEAQPAPSGAVLPTVRVSAVGAETAQRVTVRAAEYVARITNVGGRIESFVLPGYSTEGGEVLDLVNPQALAAGILPLGLATPSSPAAAAVPNEALFVLEVRGGSGLGDERVPTAAAPVEVSLRWADGAGWFVEKTLLFPVDGNQILLRVSATAPAGLPVYVSTGAGLDPSVQGSRNFFLSDGGVLLRNEDLDKWEPGDLEQRVALSGPARWAGIESNYFLAAFLLDRPADLEISRVELPAAAGPEDEAPQALETVSVALRVPRDGIELPLYLGPKKYDYLKQQGYDLHRVIDFGWLGIIVRPLLVLLNWIYAFVGNYGVAIILLTVLLRLVFLPLNHKSMVSMRKTQSLQPQMAAIRAKYKGAKEAEKRQKMNEEIMGLYKREGVSPLGGCLPMLAQMPILFAFYRLLSISIELRAAPFALWLHDLSRYDPYYVLPLTMGASMFVQQRMTPVASANPGQASVMRMMPVMFTFMFLKVPSGLVLYWLVNNLLGIAQQVYINRKIEQDSTSTKAHKQSKKGQRGKRGKKR